jgi:hypothetical protein
LGWMSRIVQFPPLYLLSQGVDMLAAAPID